MQSTGFLYGLDLGQSNDWTACVIVERLRDGSAQHYHVRHVQRWPLGTSYPAIVAAVSGQLQAPELRGRTRLVLDRTGVGRAVFDLFAELGADPVGVTITGGEEAHAAPGGWTVPKKDLAGVLQATLGTERLRFADQLPEREVLRRELQNFEVRITPMGNATYAADWRVGEHDDVVLALACALWWGEWDANRPRLEPLTSVSYFTP